MTWIYWTLGVLGYLLVAVAFGGACHAYAEEDDSPHHPLKILVAGLVWPVSIAFGALWGGMKAISSHFRGDGE